jgi:FkbM family methyltransferase
MRIVYVVLFWLLVWVGKPFGGVRPRRITHWLARKAYGNAKVQPSDLRVYRDRYGLKFLLHPHFHIDYQIIAFGIFDDYLANYIDKHIREGSVCLDVGANMGIMGLYLARKVGPTGAVHCFEPVPHVFQRLEQHVKCNNMQSIVHLHRLALSNHSGKMSMSIADPDSINQGMGSIVSQGSGNLSARIDIDVATLDEFSLRMGWERLDFIKIDIQGAEPLFFEGAVRTLRKFRPDFVMEVSPEDLIGLGKTSRDLFRQIEEIGYKIFTLQHNGEIGGQLRADEIPENYASSGVLCRMAS